MKQKKNYKQNALMILLLSAILWIPIHPNVLMAKETIALETLDKFDPGYRYKIYFKNSKKTLQVNGSQLTKDESGLSIESAEGITHFDNQDVLKIKGRTQKPQGSQVLKGALYGGITGTALGLIPAVAFWSDDCSSSGDYGDCKGLKQAGSIFLIGGIASGILVGAGIGALVPKYHKVQIVPTFQPSQGSTRVGLQLSSNF